jgi:threonine aldolase
MNRRGFASDNNAGVHPRIMKALTDANCGHCIAYGDDPYTDAAKEQFRKLFGECEVFFVFNGTGANVLSLQAMTQPFNAVICADTAHIHVDECGAPERFTGCKLLFNPTSDGKLHIPDISRHLHGIGFEHHAQPRAVSITQATEMGTIYTVGELREMAAFIHANGLLLHVDGTRVANAAVHLGVSVKEMITDTGVDILSFGGTKNGLMYGEAIVILNPALAENFKYIRKQGMQLASKTRYISAQFEEYLKDGLWLENAGQSNRMAQLLCREVQALGITVTQKVEANELFAILPAQVIGELQREFFFYLWDESRNEVRWVCSWDTTEDDIKRFAAMLEKLLDKYPLTV